MNFKNRLNSLMGELVSLQQQEKFDVFDIMDIKQLCADLEELEVYPSDPVDRGKVKRALKMARILYLRASL